MANRKRKRTRRKKKKKGKPRKEQPERESKKMDVGSEGTVEMIGSILAEADGLNELETAGWERTGGEVAPPGLGGLVGRAHVSGGLGGPHPQRLARGAVRGGRRLERGRGGRGQRDVGGWVWGGVKRVCVLVCVSRCCSPERAEGS